MSWLLLSVTGLLTVLVGALLLRVRRLDARVAGLLASGEAAESAESRAAARRDPQGTPDGAAATGEFVITRVGEPQPGPEPIPTVPAPVFADLLLKETVVQTASVLHGLRRALDPETRNRIRFHMRQEVRRSRKQRRIELREVRREWAARQRAATEPEGRAGDSAA